MLFAKTEKELGGKIDLVLCETGRLSRELIVPSFAGKGSLEEAMDGMPAAMREMVQDAMENPFEVADDKESVRPRGRQARHGRVARVHRRRYAPVGRQQPFQGRGRCFRDVATGEVKSQFEMGAAPGERCAS